MIRDAEAACARIVDVPGGLKHLTNLRVSESPQDRIYHSALLDEDYLVVRNYVDEQLRKKVGNGEYIDFSKLMPRDRIGMEEDQCMEMVNKGGVLYWVPVSDHEGCQSTAMLNGNKHSGSTVISITIIIQLELEN